MAVRKAARRKTWPKGTEVDLISPQRIQLAMDEADKGEGVGVLELARAAGYSSHSYMSRLVRGVPGARSVLPDKADAIAKRLGVPTEWLFQPRRVKSADTTKASV